MSASILNGEVIGLSPKTLKVSVMRIFKHKVYHKVMRSYKNYLVHSESIEYKIGDKVTFKLCRPLSSRKKWEVVYDCKSSD
jgi:small subunit ribosomal protein S17